MKEGTEQGTEGPAEGRALTLLKFMKSYGTFPTKRVKQADPEVDNAGSFLQGVRSGG